MGLSAGRGYPIEFDLKGPDLEGIATQTHRLMDRMRMTPGLLDVDSDYETGMPEVRIHPDRQKAVDAQVDMMSISRSIQAFFGGVEVGKYKDRGKRYDVRLRLAAPERQSPQDLAEIKIKNRSGQLLPIRDLVRIHEGASLVTINRTDRQRSVRITANVGGDVKQAEAMDKVQAIAKEVLPEGYYVEFSGGSREFLESFLSLLFALALGVVISYMLLGAQYNHFVHPFTILTALPFSTIGALVALSLTGQTLNLYSMIGMLLLTGLVCKNGILLVEFTNHLQQQGMSCRDALLQACPVRLRPILMTSASTIVGALPVVIQLGPGAESRTPMAITIIGGMLASTVLTLVTIPIVHEIMDELVGFLRGSKRTS
jgi:HAE1 family hydrophobic/amphiphilic exporter-1